MVKCIDCQNLLQGHMLLRKCNGKVRDSGDLNEEEILEMFNYTPKENEDFHTITDNDFECMAGQGQNDVNPSFANYECILGAEIDEERECLKFKKVQKREE